MTASSTELRIIKNVTLTGLEFSKGAGIGFRMLNNSRESVDFEVVATFPAGREMPIFTRVSFLYEDPETVESLIESGINITATKTGNNNTRFNLCCTIPLPDRDTIKLSKESVLPNYKIRGLFKG